MFNLFSMDDLIEKKIENINFINNRNMKNYPKIGIRPTIDGRQGGVRESLEEKTWIWPKP